MNFAGTVLDGGWFSAGASVLGGGNLFVAEGRAGTLFLLPYLYRIDCQFTSVVYWIDGAPVLLRASSTQAQTAPVGPTLLPRWFNPQEPPLPALRALSRDADQDRYTRDPAAAERQHR